MMVAHTKIYYNIKKPNDKECNDHKQNGLVSLTLKIFRGNYALKDSTPKKSQAVVSKRNRYMQTISQSKLDLII